RTGRDPLAQDRRLPRLLHFVEDVAGPERAPAARRGAIDVAGDATQPLERIEEPRAAADGEIEARVAVADDVEPGPLLLAHQTRRRVEVLLAERRVAQRVLEAAAAQSFGEPGGTRIGAGDRRRQNEITRGIEHGGYPITACGC